MSFGKRKAEDLVFNWLDSAGIVYNSCVQDVLEHPINASLNDHDQFAFFAQRKKLIDSQSTPARFLIPSIKDRADYTPEHVSFFVQGHESWREIYIRTKSEMQRIFGLGFKKTFNQNDLGHEWMFGKIKVRISSNNPETFIQYGNNEWNSNCFVIANLGKKRRSLSCQEREMINGMVIPAEFTVFAYPHESRRDKNVFSKDDLIFFDLLNLSDNTATLGLSKDRKFVINLNSCELRFFPMDDLKSVDYHAYLNAEGRGGDPTVGLRFGSGDMALGHANEINAISLSNFLNIPLNVSKDIYPEPEENYIIYKGVKTKTGS